MNQLAHPSFHHPGPYDGATSASFAPQGTATGTAYYQPQALQTPQGQRHQAFEARYGSTVGSGMVHDAGRPQPTSAPFDQQIYSQAPQHQQSIRHSASPLAGPPQQHFQQQQQYRASPPNAQAQHNYPTPPTKYPMAAPPLPGTPTSITTPAAPTSASATSPPKTPLSPASQSRDQARIAHILDLNSALFAEVSRLQSLGQGGVLNPAQAEAARARGQPDKLASEDYIHIMRRLQANLQYMMHKQQPAAGAAVPEGKTLLGPAIMSPPPQLAEQLGGMYERLQELFPEWHGVEQRAMSGRSGSGGMSAGGSATGQGMGGANGGQ